jgi:uncharacterized membrane protein YhdT
MWLIEVLVDIVGMAVADVVADRMPAWGCALCVMVPVLVILLVWLT